jgi:LysM repeat protein
VFAALLFLAAVWWLWPFGGHSAHSGYFLPTVTPTATRAVAERKPTPTTFVPTITPLPLIHLVEEGDVLGLIAEQYGTTVEALLAANNLEDSDLISIGQELIIVDAQGTPRVIHVPPPTPTPTTTPGPPFEAPALLLPRDGAAFSGEVTPVTLQWTSVGLLGEDEWYEVWVWTLGREDQYRLWTRETAWQMPLAWRPDGEDSRLHWSVAVVRRAGQETTALSPRSETRAFEWH